MPNWTIRDIPAQAGRVAIVTGATGGLGLETALALAAAGAEVVVAGRSEAKGRAAVARVHAAGPGARVRFEALDLASLASVAAFAGRMGDAFPAVNLLVNNAGVMAVPTRRATTDGFELQFGTNYLGHFALTAHLLPLLRRAAYPRVVSLSSLAHRRGAIDFAGLQAERGYRPWAAYAQSKLAMLMFALELQRRGVAGSWLLPSLAAHPGWSRTDLIANGPGTAGTAGIGRLVAAVAGLVVPVLGQSAAAGALPTLFAATAPEAQGGGYYGPTGRGEMKGAPGVAMIAPQARDEAAAARLWEVSEKLTGVAFPRSASG